MSGLSWSATSPASGTLVAGDGAVLARYHWNKANHPYFDQLRPLGHAGILTNHAPHDHRWHHGLWWSWKFVNDVLFWEDHPEYGGNRIGLGRSVVTHHRVDEDEGTVTISEVLSWRSNETDAELLREERRVVATVDRSTEDRWLLDWDQTWWSDRPTRFESTPWPEVTWGGYGGLNYRPARSMEAGERLFGEGVRGATELHGRRTPWAAYLGTVDGAETDEPKQPAQGGIALLQHPANPRFPDPIYSFSAAAGDFGFLSTAPAMREPFTLDGLEPLRIRTRVLVLGSGTEEADLAAAHEQYSADREVAAHSIP